MEIFFILKILFSQERGSLDPQNIISKYKIEEPQDEEFLRSSDIISTCFQNRVYA